MAAASPAVGACFRCHRQALLMSTCEMIYSRFDSTCIAMYVNECTADPEHATLPNEPLFWGK
jgi:hypothetical protein